MKKTWPFPGLECVQVSGLFGLFIFFNEIMLAMNEIVSKRT